MESIEDEWFETKYPNYFISKKGQVKKKLKTKEVMCNFRIGTNEYIYFSAGRKGGKINLHRLMGEVFLPNPYNLRSVDHIDRNKQNNALENLRWFSQSDNMLNRDGCLGVSFCKTSNRWLAKAGQIAIGSFNTEAEARACKYGYLKAKDIALPQNPIWVVAWSAYFTGISLVSNFI